MKIVAQSSGTLGDVYYVEGPAAPGFLGDFPVVASYRSRVPTCAVCRAPNGRPSTQCPHAQLVLKEEPWRDAFAERLAKRRLRR